MIGFFQELQESRPLRTALFASLLWHLVWLFVIFIDVRDPAVKPKLEPKIYFVGPILSDDAFNMILATKPEFSTTTYRSPDGAAAPTLDPRPQTMERAEPGDLVSVPLGQSTWTTLSGHLRDEKPYPEAVFRKKLQVQIVQKPFPIEGAALAEREMLSVPVFPVLPDFGDASQAEPEFELTVAGTGLVQEVRQLISSGDPEADLVIERYLKQWQFVPLEEGKRDLVEKGRIRIPVDGGREPV